MPKPQESGPSASSGQMTKHMNFNFESVHRSKIKNSPYNPRKIKDEARRKLKNNIQSKGLITPIVWNRRTGNVVGGHQRLKCLDSLEKTDDYYVPCAVVDFDLATEKAQNVFLNNTEAQGEWDFNQLGELLKSIPEPEDTGFSISDMYQLFGAAPSVTPDADNVMQPPTPIPENIQKKFEERKKKDDQEFLKDKKIENLQREAGDFFLTVLFKSDDDRKAFTDKYKLPDNRYVDGDVLERAMLGE